MHWFRDPCKSEVRPGAREESVSPAWLAAPAMNARDTTKVYIWRFDTGCEWHYIGSVTATTHQEKGITTLNFNYTMWKVLSQGSMNDLSLLVQMLWRMLDFYESRSIFKVKVTRSKMFYKVKVLVTRNEPFLSCSQVNKMFKCLCFCVSFHTEFK